MATTPSGESLRRLGRVRVATKYPRIAARHFAETGRQAEIVAVKGSVELAPLTGLVDGIVDLTATGKTLAENDLEVLEEIVTCTARLVANPVAHKLKAAADRRPGGRASGEARAMRIAELGPDASATESARSRPRRATWRTTCAGSSRRCASDGDAAVLRLTERFDRAELGPRGPAGGRRPSWRRRSGCSSPTCWRRCAPRSPTSEPSSRPSCASDVTVELPEGQRVEVAELPVRRAGAYVPAGRAAYPSTVVMVAVTARAAGVEEIAVCAPPGPEGRAHPVILAACALCGVNEVYRMGGAQAIAALAYGTESVPPVDVIAGPGNRYVQEAKRQVAGAVGIDGIAGPSELVVVADAGRRPRADRARPAGPGRARRRRPAGADLRRPRHARRTRAAVERHGARASERGEPAAGPRARRATPARRCAWPMSWRPSTSSWWGRRARRWRATSGPRAACSWAPQAATAFGDYVAGSNHVLPTGGAARFQSALSAATFRRRMARVSFPDGAAARLAPPGAALARAEGFPVHAESMERRA